MTEIVLIIDSFIDVKQMDSALLDLLRKNHEQNASEFTHLTTYGPSSKWSIPDANCESFWRSYCDLIGHGKDGNYCLAEMPKKHMPIMAEFTLRFHPLEGQNTETYRYDFLLSVVYCFQQAILRVLQISDRAIELICCVLDSEEYLEDNLIVSRFKLHFPYCKTEASVQTRVLRPLVLQILRTENVISRLAHQPVNNWETIIDPYTVENPSIMYGSSSLPEVPPLKMEYIFHRIEQENIDTSQAHLIELEDAFFPGNHEHVQNGIVHASLFAGDKELEYWLPMFMSISYWKGVTISKHTAPELMRMGNQPSTERQNLRLTNANTNTDSPAGEEEMGEIAERFLPMLSRERVEGDHFWLDVGRALYGTFEGQERGLQLWIQFTERSDDHTAEECQTLYPTFYNTILTVKTLAWYARQDSPDEYEKWHKDWYTPILERATSGLDTDVAEALYRVYWLDFACASLGKGSLYYFTNHIWKKLDNGHTLRTYISGDFITIFEKYRTVVSVRIQDSTDRRFKDSAEILVKKISNLITKLKKRTFKNNVLSESLEKFYIDDFDRKLDSNPDLMGMVNGVMEACDMEAVMRPGKPEDYVSKTTGLIWRYDLHWKHPLVIRLLDWLTKVFPNKQLLDYFGKISGSCLKGKNSDKLFPIMTGSGDNSKSMIKKVFESAFGAYCITFPTTLFTTKRAGGGPDPAVARSKYAHVAFAQEPDADDPLKNGTIKEMTGGDRFFARFLNDNGGEIDPMFTLFLMCNTVPIIPHSDKAMKNRVRLIPYLSTWVSNPPKTVDEQYAKRLFKKDPFFENQIPELAPAFMWYMAQMYGKYRTEGLQEPPLVTESTTEYWNENDIYLQFINENIARAYKGGNDSPDGKDGVVDEEAKLTISEVYSRFRDWFKENFQGIKCPDRPLVKGELEQRMGKTYKRAWRGIKFRVNLAQI
jgi:phage/plasmid-associated DNA primase